MAHPGGGRGHARSSTHQGLGASTVPRISPPPELARALTWTPSSPQPPSPHPLIDTTSEATVVTVEVDPRLTPDSPHPPQVEAAPSELELECVLVLTPDEEADATPHRAEDVASEEEEELSDFRSGGAPSPARLSSSATGSQPLASVSLNQPPLFHDDPTSLTQLSPASISHAAPTPARLVVPSPAGSSMETWGGDALSATRRGSLLKSTVTASSASTTRYIKRKKQQAKAATKREVQDSSTDTTEETAHGEKEDSPLSGSFRVVDVATATADGEKSNKRWFKKKRIMIPLICVSCVIISFLIALIILYPTSPRVNTTDVNLSNLTWMARPDGSISANLTLAVSITVTNPNAFGSHFDSSNISVSMAKSNESMEYIASLRLPAGYVGPKSSLSLVLGTQMRDARLSGAAELLRLARSMNVTAESSTRGRVNIFGIAVPWTATTSCHAVCTLNLWTLAVSIIDQACDTHTDT